MSPPPHRRRFLGVASLSVIGAGTLLLSQDIQPPDDTTHEERTLSERITRLLSDWRKLKDLGEARLDQLRPRGTLGGLIRELYPEPRGVQAALARPSAILRAELSRRVASDFRAGRVESVSGWLVSRTEASICAMSALLDR
jgi:hypothetical protein